MLFGVLARECVFLVVFCGVWCLLFRVEVHGRWARAGHAEVRALSERAGLRGSQLPRSSSNSSSTF